MKGITIKNAELKERNRKDSATLKIVEFGVEFDIKTPKMGINSNPFVEVK